MSFSKILLASVAIAALAACGGGNSSSSSATTAPVASAAASAAGAVASAAGNAAGSAMQSAGGAMTSAGNAMQTKGTEMKVAAPVPAGMACASGAAPVWVNTKRKTYHMSDDPFYGKTKMGAYMCEADATAKGFHKAGMKPKM